MNKALDDAEAAYAAADKAISEELVEAQTTLNTAIQAVEQKLEDAKAELETAIAEGTADLDQKIADLTEALEAAQVANAVANGTTQTEMTTKITAAQTTLSAAITAVQTELNSAKAELAQQNAQSDAQLRSEIAALKQELLANDEKDTPWQTATTVIAIVGLVCNAGLISALVIIESKKKILVPTVRNGFRNAVSKFKKPTATDSASQSDDNTSEQ